MAGSAGRSWKDLHPRHDSEFSERDWETGWVHPEIRAYAWKYGLDHQKHALNPYSEYNETICATAWTDAQNSREGRIAYFNAERCKHCLEMIDAPEYGPVRRRKRGARPINVEFNRPTDPDVIARHPIYHDQERRFA